MPSISLALEHCFNPVADMLDKAEAEWDGVERLDRMAVDYLNCEDTPLNRACVRKTMIAAVARVRQPGCKFDTIVVFESPEGLNKSAAWQVLAGDENFSDEPIIGKKFARGAGASGRHLDTRKRRTGRDEEGRGRDGQGVRQPHRGPRATGLRPLPEEATTALHRGRHHQHRRISAVANRQPPVLADAGSQDHRP